MGAGRVITNGKSAACYGTGASVAAGASATLCEFSAPQSAAAVGLSVGFGLDNIAAWASGVAFVIYIAGREVITFQDQISDLLRPEFLPLEIKGGETVRIDCVNASASAVVAAAFARIEVV